MKKIFAILLALMLTVGVVLAGCSSNNEQSSGGSSSNTSGRTRLTVFAQQDANTNLETNTFTKFAEKKFNIDFEWQVVPFDAAKEKRQIALASGDYPDAFMLIPWVDQFSQTDLIRYANQGIIIPLNDLIDKYAPNIKKAMDKHPYFKSMITAPDGKIYGISQYVECYHCSFPSKMWINSKWLKKLNLQMPKTPEEFKDVLRAFKSKDPNGNGKVDEIPLSGADEVYGTHVIPFFMNAYIYDDDVTYLMMKNGKVDFAANKPEWKKGLEFVKSMYDEGLIDKGAFTQNAEAMKKIGDNAEAQILGAGAGMHPYIFVTGGTEYSKAYDPVPPLTGPDGTSYATYRFGDIAGATFVLTNKATKEDQIAAIKLIDYMFTTEGQIRAHFGEKGVDWVDPKPEDEGLRGAKPILKPIQKKPGEKPSNTSWGAMGQYYQPREFRDAWVQSKEIYETKGYERRLHEATQKYDGHQPEQVFPFWAVWIDPAEADEAAMLRQNISDYVEQNSLQFVTGAKDLNREWDAYVEGFKSLNLERYLEIMQRAYDLSFKK